MADELQALKVLAAVPALIPCGPRRQWHQTFIFIMAHDLNRASSAFSELTYCKFLILMHIRREDWD